VRNVLLTSLHGKGTCWLRETAGACTQTQESAVRAVGRVASCVLIFWPKFRTLTIFYLVQIMVRHCGVAHCRSDSRKIPRKRFFIVPRVMLFQGEQDKQITQRRRRAWIAALNRRPDDLTTQKLENTYVCEDHFVKGKLF
jgi:THAP domain